jgi:hypothetical protein
LYHLTFTGRGLPGLCKPTKSLFVEKHPGCADDLAARAAVYQEKEEEKMAAFRALLSQV